MKAWLAIVLLLTAAAAVLAQQEESLWVPSGYRPLTAEDHQALPPAELQSIGRRNQQLMQEAIKAMTPAERQRTIERLHRYGQRPQTPVLVKQYIVRTSMMLLAVPDEETQKLQQEMEKRRREENDRVQAVIQAILREQEETSKGFPSDQKSVAAEATAIEASLHAKKSDPRALYLRALKPLRARPWNEAARVAFRRVLRRSPSELLEPALAFVRVRRAENPEEGAWDSLEAFLLLSFKNEGGEAKKLFAVAVAKNANDVESRIFPLLIAEIEQNETDIARHAPRARQAWPKPEELERVLLESIAVLPAFLQDQALKTFEAKYKRRHPADWEKRVQLLDKALGMAYDSSEFADLERETDSLLALPLSVLPEPHRSEVLVMNLRGKARLGRCAEVEPRIPSLEQKLKHLYPRETDPDAPRARTAEDVKQLRVSLRQAEQESRQIERARKGEYPAEWKELGALSPKLREEVLSEAEAGLKREVAQARQILGERDEAAAAAEWSRRELAEWEKEHGVAPDRQYDIFSRAEGTAASVRSATAECFLQKGDAASAVRVAKPCIGGGRNWHVVCLQHLVNAGVRLAATGHVREAIVIYGLVFPNEFMGWELFDAIEKAAPGSVKPPSRPRPRPVAELIHCSLSIC